MGVNLVKYYKSGKGWELAALDEGEIDEVQAVLRERNRMVFAECLSDAEHLLSTYKTPHTGDIKVLTSIAFQLFERQALHVSEILDAVLKRKVFELKQNGAKMNERREAG